MSDATMVILTPRDIAREKQLLAVHHLSDSSLAVIISPFGALTIYYSGSSVPLLAYGGNFPLLELDVDSAQGHRLRGRLEARTCTSCTW